MQVRSALTSSSEALFGRFHLGPYPPCPLAIDDSRQPRIRVWVTRPIKSGERACYFVERIFQGIHFPGNSFRAFMERRRSISSQAILASGLLFVQPACL